MKPPLNELTLLGMSVQSALNVLNALNALNVLSVLSVRSVHYVLSVRYAQRALKDSIKLELERVMYDGEECIPHRKHLLQPGL